MRCQGEQKITGTGQLTNKAIKAKAEERTGAEAKCRSSTLYPDSESYHLPMKLALLYLLNKSVLSNREL